MVLNPDSGNILTVHLHRECDSLEDNIMHDFVFEGDEVDEEAIVKHLFTIGEVALVCF